MSWTEKYRPKKISEVIGQDEAKQELLNFIKNFTSQRKKALLLVGPAGTGKTALVYSLASDLNLEILELNASDFRNKQQIQDILGQAVKQQSLFSKGKLILVDELDGISGQEDRGGLPELIRLIEKTSYPLILVCNDSWQEKLRKVKSKCLVIKFAPLDTKEILKILVKISNQEKLQVSLEVLQHLASGAKGDARAAINDLQSIAYIKNVDKETLKKIDFREKDSSILQALEKIFKTRQAKGAFDQVQNMDFDDFFLWLDENLPLEYSGSELEKAYEAMSLADVYKGRIRRWQHWRFLVYISDLLTQGIAIAKKQEKSKENIEIVKYKQPSRILKIWWANQKKMKKKAIAQRLAIKTHTSKKTAMQDLELLKIPCRNRKFREELSQELRLGEEAEWLER